MPEIWSLTLFININYVSKTSINEGIITYMNTIIMTKLELTLKRFTNTQDCCI